MPELLESPVLKQYAWSPLVNSAVQRTVDVLQLASPTPNVTTLPGLLAIHLRRGDYSRHCARLAQWGSGYMGFNLAEGMKDHWDASGAWPEDKEAARARRRAARRKEGRRREQEENGLERRWWYWAGKAGQRLTSGEATVSSTTPKSRHAIDKRPSMPSAEITLGSGKVRVQKEVDFRKAGGGFAVDLDMQQFVAKVDVETKKEESAPGKNAGAPRRWAWWGGGSRKAGKARKRGQPAELDGVEESAASRPQFTFDDLDFDTDEGLQPRSLNDADNELLAVDARDKKEEAIKHYYFKHCLPTIEEVVERAREVQDDWAKAADAHGHPHTPLTRIILLSNGWPAFLLDLASALRKEGWEVVDPDESTRKGMGKLKDVDVAVDMALAQRAEVFLGNGFSTLSANVALLRMGEGVESEGNRLL